jgi:hypothetical protein
MPCGWLNRAVLFVPSALPEFVADPAMVVQSYICAEADPIEASDIVRTPAAKTIDLVLIDFDPFSCVQSG